MPEIAIKADAVSKRYRVWTGLKPTNTTEQVAHLLRVARARIDGRASAYRDIWAVRDLSFEVVRGEILGVMGRNGAGKTTLLSILAGVTAPTEGTVEVRGRTVSLLGIGTGFHPELTGRDNVFLNGVVLGMDSDEVERKFDDIVEFSEIEDFIDLPVKRYSTGMLARLAFSVALHVEPDILLIDEILAVGDFAFREKCHERITGMADRGLTGVLVTHDATAVTRLCNRAIVLERGSLTFMGESHEAGQRYLGRHVQPGAGEVVREEDADVCLADVSVTNAAGGTEILPGDPIRLRIDLESEMPRAGRTIAVGILIADAVGRPLASLWSHFDSAQTLRELLFFNRAALVCELESLPVKPGRYMVTVELFRGTDKVDVLRNLEFDVGWSDFYGTGFVPPDHFPPLLLRHSWRLEEAVTSAEDPLDSALATGPDDG